MENLSPIAEIFQFAGTETQVGQLRLLCQGWREGREIFWSFDDVLAALGRPECLLFYAALHNNAPWQGMILVDLGPYTADLLYIYTHIDFRRRGIGQNLLQTIIKALELRPAIESLLLEVRASNIYAQNLYQKLGFKKISQRKKYYRDGEDAFVLQLTMGGKP